MSNKVINNSPKNRAVLTNKPTEGSFLLQTAKNKQLSPTANYSYLETKTIRKGEPMGLLLSLTYPADMTFVGTRI